MRPCPYIDHSLSMTLDRGRRGADLYDLSRTNLDPIARIFALATSYPRDWTVWSVAASEKLLNRGEMRKFDSRFQIYIYIYTWKYMVAFCSNRGIVSSRLIVQIFTRIFLSFSLSNFVESFHRAMYHLSRMKYFSQQRVSSNAKGGWNENFDASFCL